MTEPTKRDLTLALQGMADVLQVPLILHDAVGERFTSWVFPEECEEATELELWELPGTPGEHEQCTLLKQGNGRRRFAVHFMAGAKWDLYVQSGDLPKPFPWIDEALIPQVLPGQTLENNQKAPFLLGLYVATICQVVMVERPRQQAPPLNDLDVENVRRIGICFEKKFSGTVDAGRSEIYSLGAVPSLEEFFRVAPVPDPESVDLSAMFSRVTTGTGASFNLMALTGDFVIQAKTFQPFCQELARQRLGCQCVTSDLSSLIEAALLCKAGHGLAPAATKACHAGLTEVYAPVFSFGLIVGLVFGGQLVEGESEAVRIVQRHVSDEVPEREAMRLIRVVEAGTIEKTKQIVCGLSAMIGLLIERYSMARSETTLLGGVLAAVPNHARVLLEEACHSIKRELVVADCSAFLVDQSQLVLAATTAKKLYVRAHPKSKSKAIIADRALGQVFYALGEGLTGGVAASRAARFEQNASEARGWAGKCSETANSAQCFVVPIVYGEKCYAVLRAIRLAEFPRMPREHRNLIEAFARHLGVALRYRELTEGQSMEFKRQADQMQHLLAEAAHEFRAPLHNILSLSTALRYTRASDVPAVVRLHQKIKEEVYRAKREMDNYLLRGIEGREELKYNFQLGHLRELIIECANRFENAAGRRGLRIRVDASVSLLPRIKFDRERMEQVFTNLLDNAVKYSFANQYEGIVVKAKEKLGTVTISVVDWGLGIPPEAAKTIFEGYQRAVEDRRIFKPGVGLGLKIALEIMTRHGGSISVESEPFMDDPKRLAQHEGFKTTFTVSLPKGAET